MNDRLAGRRSKMLCRHVSKMANLQSLLDDTNLTRFLMHETRDSIHSVLIVARAHVTNMHSRTSGSSPAKIDASKMNIMVCARLV